MKIRREIIRPSGLTAVYEPDVPSDNPGLEYGRPLSSLCRSNKSHLLTYLLTLDSIIFIHGIGGHPVKTWLYTPPAPIPLLPGEVTTTTTISGGTTTPNRSRSFRNWVSPSKKGNTVKKFQFSPEDRQQFRHGNHPPVSLSSPGEDAGKWAPWRSVSLSGSSGRGRGGFKNRDTRPEIARPFSSSEAAIAGHFHEGLILTARAFPPTHSKLPTGPITTIRFAAGAASGRPPARSQFLEERTAATRASTRYWPQDFLPNSCPNSRVYVWGFKTNATYEDGHIMQDQLDIFSRGRQLLESLEELRRPSPSSPGPTHARKRREVVFVVHSTGGIILKEVGRT